VHRADAARLQDALLAAEARCEALQQQLRAVRISHAQELEQVRLDAEAEAAAAILDAGAAAARRSQQQLQQQQRDLLQRQQQQQQREMQQLKDSGDAAVQATLPTPAPRQAAADAETQTEIVAPSSTEEETGQPSMPPSMQHSQPVMTQAASADAPRMAAPLPAWPVDTPGGDDDLCRLSSASDTPASAGSRATSARGVRVCVPPLAQNAGGANSVRSDASVPCHASTLLPELTASASPVATGSRHLHARSPLLISPQLLAQQQEHQQHQQLMDQQLSAAPSDGWHAQLLSQEAQLNELRAQLGQQQHQQQPSQPSTASAGDGKTSILSGLSSPTTTLPGWSLTPSAASGSPLGQQQNAAAGGAVASRPVLPPGASPRGALTELALRGSAAGLAATVASSVQQQLGAHRAAPSQQQQHAMRYSSEADAALMPLPTPVWQDGRAGVGAAAAPGLGQTAISAAAAPGLGQTAIGAAGGAGSGGLTRLGDDIMGALSLSRYHRERSRLQEARARQHAANAQDALDRAAALRSSRLGGMLGDGSIA
jgi:hypothetical protein